MRSSRYAAALALGYTLLAAAYIVVSSGIAARMSADVEQMRQIETLKGVLYVGVTAAAIFFGARFAFARLERAHARIVTGDRALVENERRVFAGLIAGSIAHDANNVLVGVIADLEDLRAARPSGDPAMQRLELAVERLIGLNRRLLATARRGRAARAEDVDLVQAVRDTLSLAQSHEQVRRCAVTFVPSGRVVLRTRPLLVEQIVSNLVVNAGEATNGGGRVEVRLGLTAGTAELEVHDDGPGVPPERRERIFDALESTKPGGSGLGLFSVKSCVTALGGTVAVGESPLGGACFRVVLPETAPDPSDGAVPAGPPPAGAPEPAGSGAGQPAGQSPRT